MHGMELSPKQIKPLDFHRMEIELARMAALAETNLADAVTAFERCDVTSAENLVGADARVDAHFHAIQNGIYSLLTALSLIHI